MSPKRQSKTVSTVHYAAVDSNTNYRTEALRPPPSKGIVDYYNDSWTPEILAMLSSFVCMGVVVYILLRMQSKPLHDWPVPVISLNTMLAIAITAAKSLAAVAIGSCIAQSKWIAFKKRERKLEEMDLFEEASRGPWGSVKLLWFVNWRTGFASVGAIITILALGLDAFAQQVIKLDTRMVQIDDGGASFGLSHIYNGSAVFRTQSDGQYIAEDATADVAMQGAIYSGVFSPNPAPLFKCNSSCIWNESYISLGFQSTCTNVSAATISTNKSNATTILMTTPGNVSFDINFSPTSSQTAMKVAAKSLIPVRINENEDFTSKFARIAVVRAWTTYEESEISINTTKYINTLEIIECDIGLAAYNYSKVSASGNQFNTTTDTIPLPAPANSGPTTRHGRLVFNKTGLPSLQVNTPDIAALAQYFRSPRFSGEIIVGETVKELPGGIGLALQKQDIPKAFDRMALSMTEQLRSSNEIVANGLTVSPVVFVRVRWVWLALPAAVLILATLLLLATIINSRRYGCLLWRSSVLAMLFHDVSSKGGAGVLRTDVRSLKELDVMGEEMKARF
ncbi:hypothetical protein P280DRAFT_465990, partial [Massarina eburnea CBS 473.64]